MNLLKLLCILLVLYAPNSLSDPLTEQEANEVIAEVIAALSKVNFTDDDNDLNDDPYWEEVINLFIEHASITDQLFAAITAALPEQSWLIKDITKEIKWREFICSHNRFELYSNNPMQRQNTMYRLSQHSFRQEGQHTIHDTLQTGCNRSIYRGDNPAILRRVPSPS